MLTVQSPTMRLIVRAEVGQDEWGQPVVEDVPLSVKGYFYQFGTEDPDRSGTVAVETGKVMLFDVAPGVEPHEWHAVELDIPGGSTRRWEIIGPPEPKFSLARKQLHHWECLVSEAAA